jgi:hypothetical protein
MNTFTVLFDACVLYPAPLRDLLMQLAMSDLFRARWTDQIHDEWIKNLLNNRSDLTRENLERTRDLMNSHVLDCLVCDYENLVEGLALPDSNDRHVLAASIRGQVAVIVTFNLQDFPADYMSKFGIEAQHPDEFIRHLIDLAPGRVCACVKRHRARLRNPPKTVEEYLTTLEKQQLPESVQALREFVELI